MDNIKEKNTIQLVEGNHKKHDLNALITLIIISKAFGQDKENVYSNILTSSNKHNFHKENLRKQKQTNNTAVLNLEIISLSLKS